MNDILSLFNFVSKRVVDIYLDFENLQKVSCAIVLYLLMFTHNYKYSILNVGNYSAFLILLFEYNMWYYLYGHGILEDHHMSHKQHGCCEATIDIVGLDC